MQWPLAPIKRTPEMHNTTHRRFAGSIVHTHKPEYFAEGCNPLMLKSRRFPLLSNSQITGDYRNHPIGMLPVNVLSRFFCMAMSMHSAIQSRSLDKSAASEMSAQSLYLMFCIPEVQCCRHYSEMNPIASKILRYGFWFFLEKVINRCKGRYGWETEGVVW